MDYSSERRHRRRRERFQSPSSYDFTSSRDDDDDDDDIEQEIIERAIEIERSREKSLRRQFEYIVHSVKELERRRQYRHRTPSPEYYDRSISPSRRRNLSPDRFYRTNDFETRTRSCQITMIYGGVGNERHGDEIMILQENLIVFKGFLRPQETFTFKFHRRHRQLIIKLEFFINELFECYLSIDCEQQEIQEKNQLFQLQNIRLTQPINDERQINKTNHSRRHHTSKTNGEKKSTVDNDRHHRKSKSPKQSLTSQTSRETSYSKQRSKHSPSPPKSPSKKQNELKSEKSKSNSNQIRSQVSRQSSAKSTSTNEKKSNILPSIHSDQDEDEKILERSTTTTTTTTKPSYGPPQLSAFVRSDSESFSDELSNPVKQKDEEEKSSSELVKSSENSPEKKEDNEEEEGEGPDTSDSGNFVNFLQLLQAMSGGGLRVSSSGDDGDGIQGLLARLGIVTQNNSRKKSTNITPRQIGNVEDYLLVYLDSSPPDESILNQFRGLINYLKMFDDADDCIAFINTISNEKVVFIVSDALGDPVVSRIQDLQQLFAIYVLCQTEEQAENWSSNQPKIHGIYTNINDIIEQIQIDIEKDEENSLSFSYTLINGNPKDEPLFIINQILKEILLDQDEMIEAKKELIDFCRNEYENNSQQLTFIQQFENEFDKDNILQYFQKEKFIYKMLNKGFRIPEIDILFKLRLFIQNLHQLILSSSSDLSLKTIYRTQFLTKDQIETFKKCADNGFIAFSNFFIASPNRPELKSSENNSEEGEEILFEINVSNSKTYMTFNDKLLVTFGLVTKIENIEKDKFGKTIIHLITINSDDQQLEKLIEPIRKEIRAPYPSLRLIKLFIELDQYSQALHLGQVLIGDLPHVRKDPLLALARTYHSLGTVLYEKEDYDQALEVIKRSHELYLRFLPEDAPQLSPTWNNMGSIYLRQGKTDLALEYHEKALQIQLKSPSPDLPSIISYSNNIGGVYLKLERYEEALVHFKRALQIEEQTLASNHPELAGTYHRIGGVYFRLNNFEKALEYYDKTLQIELNSLPDNHPTVAVTYHNRGTAFEGLGKLEEAVESAEKAVERLLKTLPKEHPQVRMNQTYVDRLKQKLWVKQLFTS